MDERRQTMVIINRKGTTREVRSRKSKPSHFDGPWRRKV
jgi:hypothetical protein